MILNSNTSGVIWQPQVERRWLAGLLGDDRAVAPLLKFLKTTGLGGARGREREWERKNKGFAMKRATAGTYCMGEFRPLNSRRKNADEF